VWCRSRISRSYTTSTLLYAPLLVSSLATTSLLQVRPQIQFSTVQFYYYYWSSWNSTSALSFTYTYHWAPTTKIRSCR
jgi:hypothetical protein